MDKITHQVRAKHWTKIMNECKNSGMSKTTWCRTNEISEKQFFYWLLPDTPGKYQPQISALLHLSDFVCWKNPIFNY